MLQINKEKWEIYDPDKILSYELEGFDTSALKFGADIHPREDMMQFKHKESNYIVDFGYYGCEVKLDGFYAAKVIDGSLEEGLHDPLENHKTKDFLKGVANVKSMLYKYT